MSDLGWGADVRLLSFVIPDLIRDPQQRRSHGPRIKSGVTMINRAAIGRTPPLSSDMPGPPPSQLIRRSPASLPRRYCLLDRLYRSEEHTSILLSLMLISYTLFCF